eukprot:11525124-Prorocentrum_lima.AAC.1
MTSSLVGSEMCIRDSDERAHRSRTLDHGYPKGLVRKRGASRGMTKEAVSYTHLTLPTICSV